MTRSHTWSIVTNAAVATMLVGCAVELDETTTEVSAALDRCARPALGAGSVCDLGGGRLEFQVTLPGGQQYVEVFARQNGIQNVATAIQGNGVAHGDGTTTYALTRDGYAATDAVEYRFYSYLPSSPGVFTPGPAEQIWQGYATIPVSKDAAVIYASLGTGPAADRNFGSASTVDIGEYHLVSDGLFGYPLAPHVPAGATVTAAELVIPAAYAPGGPSVTLRLSRVTGAWSESSVTWNSRPGYAPAREVPLQSGVENRIDVTPEVAAALTTGELGVALRPSTQPTVDNVFIDAKEKVGGAPTKLRVRWRR